MLASAGKTRVPLGTRRRAALIPQACGRANRRRRGTGPEGSRRALRASVERCQGRVAGSKIAAVQSVKRAAAVQSRTAAGRLRRMPPMRAILGVRPLADVANGGRPHVARAGYGAVYRCSGARRVFQAPTPTWLRGSLHRPQASAAANGPLRL